MRVRIVVFEREILKTERVDVPHFRVDSHGREGSGVPGQLQLSLFDMIRVKVRIPKAMDEVTCLVTENLRNHHREERLARNIEGNTQKEVGASLIELAGEPGASPVCLVNIELKEKVAGRKGHLINLSHIPRGNYVAT